jgi:ankyrin repeat protein
LTQALKQEKNMLQVFAEKFRRYVRALALPVVVLAVIFAALNGCAGSAERQLNEAAESGDAVNEAAESGDAAAVERLLAAGADIEHRNADGSTALMVASQNGHGEIVEALLAKGAAVDVQSKDGATALIQASDYGYGEIVEAL